jgi:hypothetical protein
VLLREVPGVLDPLQVLLVLVLFYTTCRHQDYFTRPTWLSVLDLAAGQ